MFPTRILVLALLAAPVAASAADPSKGVYRIPYADGTSMRVGRDHLTHTPPGRLDLNGTGGGTYRIVAAAAGKIVGLEDSFDERQDSATAKQCNNNYVWIAHANGEWSKYSHMRKGTTTGKAGLKLNDTVTAGQYLGDEGQVGCAGGDHLHFEVAVPPATAPFFSTVGGFIGGGSAANRNPRMCVRQRFLVAGDTHTARATQGALPANRPEIARHGLPLGDFQCLFDQGVAAGYEVAFFDMYDAGGDAFVNAVLRPSTGTTSVRHGLTSAEYQSMFDDLTKRGFRLAQLESYRDNGVRYAVVFRRGSGPAQAAYHGKTAAEHQARLDDLTAKGFRPKAISVVSDGGARRYTAFYEKADVGSWQAKSQLTPAEYQTLFNSNAATRQVVYLNSYVHDGQPFIIAIWNGRTNAAARAKHGMSGDAYQAEYEGARADGLLTRAVTGYADGPVRFAAVWRK